MKLFDDQIRKMTEALNLCEAPRRFAYSAAGDWPDAGHNELVMLRDAAFELGGGMLQSVNCTCVTTNEELVSEDEILVYGRDLTSINADTPFARMAFLLIDEPSDDDEKTYNAIKNLEFVRYNVHPKGYMIRVSAESNQEQVRISKDAKAKGITFESVGNDYISHYKKLPGVKAVRLIFMTDNDDLSQLIAAAKKVDEITNTLTHILDGIPTDCGSCSLKPVCDEVDGLKEMHMKQREELKNKRGGRNNA